jgi:hypothetical protein
MTDRADEIVENVFGPHIAPATRSALVNEIRAYGDERYKQGRAMGLRDSTNYGEGRLAGLEEAADKVRVDCIACGGSGVDYVTSGNIVTPEMAMDAGQPERAGEYMEGEAVECEYCGRPIQSIRALKEKP